MFMRPGEMVALLGVDDGLVVVETEDALLITTRGTQSQDVSKVVRQVHLKGLAAKI